MGCATVSAGNALAQNSNSGNGAGQSSQNAVTTENGTMRAVRHADRVDVFDGGSLVTSYRFQSGTKPILWPLIGPDGMRMSREYPMVSDSKNEDHDHPHHRSLWMTFGEVDDLDFWAEGPGKGIVEHQKVVSVVAKPSNSTAPASIAIEAEHLWIRPPVNGTNAAGTPTQPTGTKDALLHEHCLYTIHGSPDERFIDCEYVLTNVKADKSAIHFGDTKEGMFAIRIPESMRADKSGGHILNSVGEKDGATWGRPASWVDYTGKATPSSPQTHGISIMIHPKSYGADGFWHVRTYGLFAHNPIGIKHFIEGKSDSASEQVRAKAGGIRLEFGDSLHLCYRVCFHRGEWTSEENNSRFAGFASTELNLSPTKR